MFDCRAHYLLVNKEKGRRIRRGTTQSSANSISAERSLTLHGRYNTGYAAPAIPHGTCQEPQCGPSKPEVQQADGLLDEPRSAQAVRLTIGFPEEHPQGCLTWQGAIQLTIHSAPSLLTSIRKVKIRSDYNVKFILQSNYRQSK